MKTFIWDLDGTLADSYEIITHNVHTVLSAYVDMSKEEIYKRITDTSIRSFFIIEAEKNNLSIRDIHRHYMALDGAIKPTDYKLIDGAKEILKILRDMGHQHFIYTHRDLTTIDIIKVNGIEDTFIEVVTSENGFERKPGSQALDYLVNKYSLDKERSYYVGDRSLDVECGNNAGLKSIYFNPTGQKVISADFNVTSLLAIKDL